MIERSTKMIVYLKVHPKNIVHEKLDRSNKRAVLTVLTQLTQMVFYVMNIVGKIKPLNYFTHR